MTQLPEEFELTGIARPGDIVIFRVTKHGMSLERKVKLAQELVLAAEFWGVRFVLLDAEFIDVVRGDADDLEAEGDAD